MAMDVFLELTDIDGESQDAIHEDKIDILAWSWGMVQSGTTHMGGGSGGGKVSVQDISVTKYVDKSTPTIMQKCCTGEHIAEGSLIIRKAGGEALEYVVIDMEDIIITSVSTGGSGGEDRLTENVSLNFGKFTYTYTEQEADGSAGAEVPVTYDIAANEEA